MRAVEDSSTIDRRGLLILYILYQLTWTLAMFYAWPEGYRLPPIAPPAPAMGAARPARLPQLIQPAVGRGRAQGRRGEDDFRFDGRAHAVDAAHARAPELVVHAVHAEHGLVALNCGTLPL